MKTITKSTNDFVQITRGYIREMRELARRSAVAHSILWLFTERMNRTNAVVISQTGISEIIGAHRSTINRAIRLLVDERWVQVIKIGTANGYVVNSKVVWRASNKTGKRYATFHADIIATASDQGHAIESWDDIELRQIPVLSKTELPVQGSEELPPPDQLDLLDIAPEDEVPLINNA